MTNKYEEYARVLVTGLCLNSVPKVTRTIDDRGVLLTISGINREEMGMVIGRDGEHVKAIRTLLKAVGKSENAHVSIRIEEPMDPIQKLKVELESEQ